MTLDANALPPGIVTNAARLLAEPDAVQAVDPDHYTVASLRHPDRRVRVYRNGTRWRCSSDRRNDHDAPCAHILAVLGTKGLVVLPTLSPKPSGTGVESEVERRATELLPTRLPELLAQLLAANPGEEAPYSGYGRPPRPAYPQTFQAVARAAFRHTIPGSRDASNDRRHNPWGRVSRATLARFLDSEARSAYVQILAEATVAPARASEPAVWPRRLLRFAKPDGTRLDLEVLVSPRYNLWLPSPGSGGPATDEPIPGGTLAFTHVVAQRTEALCLVVAHNLRRLGVLELAEGLRIQFHRLPAHAPPAVAPASPALARSAFQSN